MANEQNLKPIKSKKRARELGSKGGQKFAENQRRRKSLRENMDILLGLPIKNPEDYNSAIEIGVDPEDTDNAMLLTIALFGKAKSGDVSAYKEIRDLIGEEDGGNTGVQIIDDY